MSNTEYEALLPANWLQARGYAHGVVSRGTKIVRISGQLPAENGQLPVKEGLDIGTQWLIALSNILTLVRHAGGDVENIVFLRAYVTDMQEFHTSEAAVGEAWKKTLGKHFPAMTLVEIGSLVDPNAKVEIECEAVLA